jgi:hypothetical protein
MHAQVFYFYILMKNLGVWDNCPGKFLPLLHSHFEYLQPVQQLAASFAKNPGERGIVPKWLLAPQACHCKGGMLR